MVQFSGPPGAIREERTLTDVLCHKTVRENYRLSTKNSVNFCKIRNRPEESTFTTAMKCSTTCASLTNDRLLQYVIANRYSVALLPSKYLC